MMIMLSANIPSPAPLSDSTCHWFILHHYMKHVALRGEKQKPILTTSVARNGSGSHQLMFVSLTVHDFMLTVPHCLLQMIRSSP